LRQDLVVVRQVWPASIPHVLRTLAVLLRRHEEVSRRRLDLPDLVGIDRHLIRTIGVPWLLASSPRLDAAK
jgi:hypothetical protein